HRSSVSPATVEQTAGTATASGSYPLHLAGEPQGYASQNDFKRSVLLQIRTVSLVVSESLVQLVPPIDPPSGALSLVVEAERRRLCAPAHEPQKRLRVGMFVLRSVRRNEVRFAPDLLDQFLGDVVDAPVVRQLHGRECGSPGFVGSELSSIG